MDSMRNLKRLDCNIMVYVYSMCNYYGHTLCIENNMSFMFFFSNSNMFIVVVGGAINYQAETHVQCISQV